MLIKTIFYDIALLIEYISKMTALLIRENQFTFSTTQTQPNKK